MLEELIAELLAKEDFLPFRIRLVSGAFYNIDGAEQVAELEAGLYIIQRDRHWIQFPYSNIESVESLIDGES